MTQIRNGLFGVAQFQITQNCIVIWLNLNKIDSNSYVDDWIDKLQHITNSIETFTDLNQCIDYLTDVTDEGVFLIMCGSHVQQLVSFIEDIHQLHSIYLFEREQTHEEPLVQKYKKVKGVFSQIESICEALKQDFSYQYRSYHIGA